MRYSSIVYGPLDSFEDLPFVGKVERLVDTREGSVISAYSFDWSLEMQEAFALNHGSQLSSNSP